MSGTTEVQVEFSVTEDVAPGAHWDEPLLRRLVSEIVERELGGEERSARPCYAIGLHLVSDEHIRELNREHRGKDAHTDVLSFGLHDPNGMRFVLPPGQPIGLGDVVVSYPRALAQAEAYGHSPERELAYLVAHGTLHILGYDHEEEEERRLMRAREEEALAPLGLTR